MSPRPPGPGGPLERIRVAAFSSSLHGERPRCEPMSMGCVYTPRWCLSRSRTMVQSRTEAFASSLVDESPGYRNAVA